MNVLTSTVTGNYTVRRNNSEADCVIGQSFGFREDEPGLVNVLLAEYIINLLTNNGSLPLILQGEVADALNTLTNGEIAADLTIRGKPSNGAGKGLDSWGVLEQAKQYMRKNKLNRPIIVAQAHHVGRVAMQATRIGMEPVVSVDLPRQFDPESIQPWTRSAARWVPRELLGMVWLKASRKL